MDGDANGAGAEGYPTPTVSIGIESLKYETREASTPALLVMEMRPFAWSPGPEASEQDKWTKATRPVSAIASLRILKGLASNVEKQGPQSPCDRYHPPVYYNPRSTPSDTPLRDSTGRERMTLRSRRSVVPPAAL